VIIFDVGVKSKALDSTAPPISFLDPVFLGSVKEILHKQGNASHYAKPLPIPQVTVLRI
jgi:hypothetical protein